jgi:hypothetical protein
MVVFLIRVVSGGHAGVAHDTWERAASERRLDALAAGGEGRHTAL